jgi:hypothetical protein
VQALRAWAAGRPHLAANCWETVLLHRPHDLLALRGAHDSYVLLGDADNMRDSISRQFPYWNTDIAGYDSVLAMFAHGLLEVRS